MRKVRLLGVAALLGLLGWCGVWTSREASAKRQVDRRNRVGAEQLLQSLAGYRADAGHWPERLEELVPATPGDYHYQSSEDGGRFLLRYDEAPMGSFAAGSYVYDSAQGSWVLEPD